jgi:glycosyltransferase involved in cell wall biosynthesis
MDSDDRLPRLLVLTSTFPRWRDDREPRFVLDLCRALAERFRVHVVAPHDRGAILRETWNRIQIHRFRYAPLALQSLAFDGGILSKIRRNPARLLQLPGFALAQWRTARQLLASERFAAIHAHWILPQGAIALALQHEFAVPAICTAHGGDLYALHRAGWNGLIKSVLGRCSGVTVVSRAMAETLQTIGLVSSRLEVIPMGVDFRGLFRADPALGRQPQTLLFAGRLVEKKGVQHLLAAMARLATSHPRLRLDIAGFGPAEPHLRRLVGQWRLDGRVRFLGALSHRELADRYRRATLTVIPSVTARSGDAEGFGLVIAEALGCGCPVIASDLPAIRDQIEDGVTGLLARPADPAHLAERIAYLLARPEARRALARRGRDHVLARFDWQRIGLRYGDFITAIIDRAADSRSPGAAHARPSAPS